MLWLFHVLLNWESVWSILNLRKQFIIRPISTLDSLINLKLCQERDFLNNHYKYMLTRLPAGVYDAILYCKTPSVQCLVQYFIKTHPMGSRFYRINSCAAPTDCFIIVPNVVGIMLVINITTSKECSLKAKAIHLLAASSKGRLPACILYYSAPCSVLSVTWLVNLPTEFCKIGWFIQRCIMFDLIQVICPCIMTLFSSHKVYCFAGSNSSWYKTV